MCAPEIVKKKNADFVNMVFTNTRGKNSKNRDLNNRTHYWRIKKRDEHNIIISFRWVYLLDRPVEYIIIY